jgi:transcription elongation factor GreA
MIDKPVYLTREGRTKFEEELKSLEENERPRVAERIKQAKDLGDLSENAEYEAAKQEQGFIEGRIRDLRYMLANAEMINEDTNGSTEVQLGSTVTLREEDGEELTYTIVGTSEANPRQGKISNESPVGRALLGKHVNQTVVVATPDGSSYTLKIVKIK